MFLVPVFAIAGLVAAAGPIIIHLLNRRRFRVVRWGAMDFLREAITRSRRILQLRDLLLLALRTLCILLFGAAMARPFLEKAAGPIDPDQPVHAVVLIDNSLSMAYQPFEGTALDEAKAQAADLIGHLPHGSRMSILPVCGLDTGVSYTPYYTTDDALEALENIQPVDRSARADETIDLALEACRRLPTMPVKQMVLFTDRQVADWPVASLDAHLAKLPAPLQVVEVDTADPDNAWIADFRLQDGVADLQSPAVFVATIGYEGPFARRDVPVTLSIDGVTIAQQLVDLQPGGEREVPFPPYTFNLAAEPGRATFAAAEVSIPQDKLSADDQRFLVVPVVATLPVVFVDQHGPDEDPRVGRYGETHPFRRLLVPLLGETERQRQFIEIRHVTIDRLSRELLQDARLVVIAGVPDPAGTVPLLREYVDQGGNLFLAAGGFFDPAAWSEEAWLDGLGILPAPLRPVTVGQTPEETRGAAKHFQLDFDTLIHDYFLIEGESRERLEDLFALPFFFKTAQATVDELVLRQMSEAVSEAIKHQRADLAEIDERLAELREREAGGELTAAERSRRADLLAQRSQREPTWLLWECPQAEDTSELPIEDVVDRTKPQVLARYTNGLPFLVQRDIGRGQVLLMTTGVTGGWNTLRTTDAMLLFDRVFRDMLKRTIPPRNLATHEDFVLPVSAAQRSAEFTLTTPEGYRDALSVEAVCPERFGVPVRRRAQRGIYRVTASRTGNGLPGDLESQLFEIPLGVSGPAEESQLLSHDEITRRRKRGQAESVEVTEAAAVGLQRASLHGTDLWKWVMAAVLVCLLVELLILAWPAARGERTA